MKEMIFIENLINLTDLFNGHLSKELLIRKICSKMNIHAKKIKIKIREKNIKKDIIIIILRKTNENYSTICEILSYFSCAVPYSLDHIL